MVFVWGIEESSTMNEGKFKFLCWQSYQNLSV